MVQPTLQAFRRAMIHNTSSYKFALARALIKLGPAGPVLTLQSVLREVAGHYYRNIAVFRLRESTFSQGSVVEQTVQQAVAAQWDTAALPYRPPSDFIEELARRLDPVGQPAMSYARYVLAAWGGRRGSSYPPVGENPFFRYTWEGGGRGTIRLTRAFSRLIAGAPRVLDDLVVLSWAEFLERLNDAPSIVKKVRGATPNRRGLAKIRALMHMEPALFEPAECWLCGSSLAQSDFTFDHVIPFQFIANDELWNLVPAHGGCNSAKGARVGGAPLLRRLAQRNLRLWTDGPEAIRRRLLRVIRSEDEAVTLVERSARNAILSGFEEWP